MKNTAIAGLALVLSGLFGTSRLSAETFRDSVSRALDYQLTRYPASQYRDVYKNFMQDFFGPGHILTDTVAAGRYLRRELSDSESFDGPLYEPTGFKGNFYRVNLSVIKDGLVPYDIFFRAFTESIQGIIPPTDETWMNMCRQIDDIIKEKDLKFPDEKKDREELSQQFKEGNFIVHHSQRYNDAVNFHYRIISKDNFKRIILPYLENKSNR